MFAHLRAALGLFVLLSVLTGVIYPVVVTVFAQAVFPNQANGSLIEQNGRLIGSELIGQPFNDPRNFWGRPSATSPEAYNAASSTGSNLGPTNPALLAAITERVTRMQQAHPDHHGPVPADLVTASASGLDPHISPVAAEFQVARVAKARGLSEDRVRELVAAHTEGRTFGLLGEPRVNVLRINLALDDPEIKARVASRQPAYGVEMLRRNGNPMTRRFDWRSYWRNPPKHWRICLVALAYTATGFLAGGIIGMLLGGYLLGSFIGAFAGALIGASMEERR
jgi:K+-transporting ATPase ATPase C chain